MKKEWNFIWYGVCMSFVIGAVFKNYNHGVIDFYDIVIPLIFLGVGGYNIYSFKKKGGSMWIKEKRIKNED